MSADRPFSFLLKSFFVFNIEFKFNTYITQWRGNSTLNCTAVAQFVYQLPTYFSIESFWGTFYLMLSTKGVSKVRKYWCINLYHLIILLDFNHLTILNSISFSLCMIIYQSTLKGYLNIIFVAQSKF